MVMNGTMIQRKEEFGGIGIQRWDIFNVSEIRS